MRIKLTDSNNLKFFFIRAAERCLYPTRMLSFVFFGFGFLFFDHLILIRIIAIIGVLYTIIREFYLVYISYRGEVIIQNGNPQLNISFLGARKISRLSLLYIKSEKTFYIIRQGVLMLRTYNPLIFEKPENLKSCLNLLRENIGFEREVEAKTLIGFENGYFQNFKQNLEG